MRESLLQRRAAIVRDTEVMLLNGLFENRECLTRDEHCRYVAAIDEIEQIDDLLAETAVHP